MKMKSFLRSSSVCVLFIFFERTNGQCPINNNKTITSCDGSQKFGTYIYVDTHEINSPCTCTVISFFTGELLVLAKAYNTYFCNNVAKINSAIINCKPGGSETTVVEVNDTVIIRVDYKESVTSGDFFQCLEITKNGGESQNLTVTCGEPTTVSSQIAETTFSIISTVTAVSTKSRITETSTVVAEEPTFVEKSTSALPNSVIYIIAGAAAGGLVILAFVVLIVILVLITKTGRKFDKAEKTDDTEQTTNRAFDENYSLPDNPLYHSAQPMDEVGYSSVQKNDLGLPPTEATIKKNKDPNYDIPTNSKPINDSDTSPVPIYAVPNKSGASPSEENEPQAMYAQVSKPGKSTTQGPMQSANQGGLVYLEVEKDAISVNENTPYTQNGNKDSVLYAEIKRN